MKTRSFKKLWWLIPIVVILAGGGYYGYTRWKQSQIPSTATETLQTTTARTGNLIIRASGTGTLVAVTESDLVFGTSGKLKSLPVKVGDIVDAGQLLAELDDVAQQTAVAQAKQNLLELTSPAAIASAQQNVAQYQQDIYNDEIALANLTTHYSQALIDDAYAAYVVAKDNYQKVAERYAEDLKLPQDDPKYARAYQEVYDFQVAMKNALGVYNLYTGHSNPAKVAAAKAQVDLDKAHLLEAQNYLAALAGGEVPADATGTALDKLNQAKIDLQSAQDNLAATKLYAPYAGTVMAVNTQVGESVGSATAVLTIADLSRAYLQIYMDQNDWSNIKIGYTADVIFDALPNQTFTGKVTQVSPQLVSIQGSSVVEGLVELEQQQASGALPALPLGVSASVDVVAAQALNVVLIPVQALHELATDSFAVFLVTDGKPTLQMVTVGLQDATYAEIKSGLKAGDVISTGIQAIANNSQGKTP
jgi:HlyD family secretion protein